MTEIQQEWFKTGDAAKLMGLSRRFVSALVEQGRLQAARIGSRTSLIHRDEINRFLESYLTGGA